MLKKGQMIETANDYHLTVSAGGGGGSPKVQGLRSRI